MKLHTYGQIAVAELPATGPALTDEQGALDVIGQVYGSGVEWVAIPAERLAPEFFELSNRQAGGFFQKLTNYQLKAVVIGDISDRLEKSKALRDFVSECNAGQQFRFVTDFEAFSPTATSH